VVNRKPYNPIYRQFIELIYSGFLLLDKTSQNQVVKFVKNQQHPNGGFKDRAGNPDIYYSLFGVWLSEALNLTETLENHKQFIKDFDVKGKGVAENFALILIKTILPDKNYKKPSLYSILKILPEQKSRVSFFYKIFLFFLAFDALYPPNRILNFFAKIGLKVFNPSGENPCSIFAALMVAKQKIGLNVDKETTDLLSYFEEGKGFKMFGQVKSGDLLSTAVALFALKNSGQDLRLVAPTCLGFIQHNFDSGAFLSGDGDLTRDLEYTFYGLMALGVLS
jgi:hypothetical protein